MVTETGAAIDRRQLAVLTREYRLSLALVLAGIVLVVTAVVVGSWPNSNGIYATTTSLGWVFTLSGTAGGMLILLAGTVAYYHWSFLRRARPIG
jgi:hypothetical protein